MKEVKVIFLFCLSILLGMGLSDWSSTTKNNTDIYNAGAGNIIRLVNGEEYKDLKKWYFYKDCIIGVRSKYIEEKYEEVYFIINEKDGATITFKDEISWKNTIQLKALNPKYLKRWFDDDWIYFNSLAIASIFLFPVTLSIIGLNIFFLVRLYRMDEKWKKWVIYSLITPLLLIIVYLVGRFPESF